jgi:hypothetical protein
MEAVRELIWRDDEPRGARADLHLNVRVRTSRVELARERTLALGAH